MKLYLHTPYYKNSNFMAHLCEHLVLHPRSADLDEYMLRYYDGDGWLHGEYTYLKFRPQSTLEQNLDTIQNPRITQKVVNYEMDIFAEEFGERGYFLRLIDKVRQQIYGKKHTSQPKKPSLKEIVEYHDTWYKNGRWVARDEDSYEVIAHNIPHPTAVTSVTLPQYQYQEVLLEWLRNHVWWAKHTSVSDLVINEIIEDIFTAWDNLQKRYHLWSYYTQGASSAFDSQYMLLRFSAHTRYNVTPEFVQSYKKIITELVFKDGYWKWISAIGLIHHAETIDAETIIQCIDLITYEYLHSLTSQIHN